MEAWLLLRWFLEINFQNGRNFGEAHDDFPGVSGLIELETSLKPMREDLTIGNYKP